jgi:hypothetical protein
MYNGIWIVVGSKVTGRKLIPLLGKIATKHIDPPYFRLFDQGAVNEVNVFLGIALVS